MYATVNSPARRFSRMPPNILLVVWDACRYDFATKHASFLNDLSSTGVEFTNAIAPSPWSLPSHASLFSGRFPHEHEQYRFGDEVGTPLVNELKNNGYRTYGVSANGFASQRTGFHEDFDRFRYTGGRDPFLSGMDVSGTAQNLLRKPDMSTRDALFKILRQIPSHDHSVKSFCNLAAVATGELATSVDPLQRIPHPVFAPTSDYSYRPETNTRAIQSMLDSHDSADPFFIFTNYMDTHRCYKPDKALQEQHFGTSLSYDELVSINETVAAPWEFERRKEAGTLEEADIETIRGLYAGEVERADQHLRKLYDALEEAGELANTVLIVTADHGENLGETDALGRRRMGHEASVSDAVLQVPLLISHPELESATVEEPVSLRRLFDFCLRVGQSDSVTENTIRESLGDGPAISQYPATGGADQTIEKYPSVSERSIRHRSSEHSVVVYDDDWRLIGETTGKRIAIRDGETTEYADAPDQLQSLVASHLESLSDGGGRSLDKKQVSDLEALGYL